MDPPVGAKMGMEGLRVGVGAEKTGGGLCEMEGEERRMPASASMGRA